MAKNKNSSAKSFRTICAAAKNVSELLPLLYLRDLSTGDFREALPVLLGENAAGLSPSAITRLCSEWTQEYQTWKKALADRDARGGPNRAPMPDMARYEAKKACGLCGGASNPATASRCAAWVSPTPEPKPRMGFRAFRIEA